MKRRIYDVSPKGKQWAVKERDAERAVANFDNKIDAVKRAREIANNLPLAQIVIRKQDGTIRRSTPMAMIRFHREDKYANRGVLKRALSALCTSSEMV